MMQRDCCCLLYVTNDTTLTRHMAKTIDRLTRTIKLLQVLMFWLSIHYYELNITSNENNILETETEWSPMVWENTLKERKIINKSYDDREPDDLDWKYRCSRSPLYVTAYVFCQFGLERDLFLLIQIYKVFLPFKSSNRRIQITQ